MTHPVALPFTLGRSSDVYGAKEITSTHERVDGLLRFDGHQLVIQWRTSRAIDRYGSTIRTDREVEAVREVTLPISALASAEVRWSWRRWPPGYYLVLTATDLLGFESLAGKEGLELKHPAQLEIRIKRPSKMAALEFASELEMELADRALRAAEQLQIEPMRSSNVSQSNPS